LGFLATAGVGELEPGWLGGDARSGASEWELLERDEREEE